jgi:molybdate transport system substrate-binding protein
MSRLSILLIVIHVSAAASLSEAVTEIAAQYEAVSGNKVVLNFGASSTLARQIELGAPADVFLSADEAKMDRLQSLGLISPQTRVSFLSNELVVMVASERGATIRKPSDLLRIRRLALAEPSSVPAGIYAKQWLEKIGLWQKLESKVLPTDNVRGALAAVEAGNADAAIVYRTDARIAKRARIAMGVKGPDAPAIAYSFAAVSPAKEPARDFLAFVQKQRQIFIKHGFIIRKR